MSPMPEGWSVDVRGAQILVRVSGRPDDQFYLDLQEARSLRVQLHLAYLLAGHNTAEATAGASELTQDIPMSALLAADTGHDIEFSPDLAADLLEIYRSLASRARDVPAEDEAATEVDRLPANWRISASGRAVDFVVPASAADGHFSLSRAEALATAFALVRQAERARLNAVGLRRKAIEAAAGSLTDTFKPGYLEDLRRDWPDDDQGESGGAE